MVTKDLAIKAMIGILSIVIIFHFLVLFQMIPYEIVWAGKIKSVEEMQAFETVSILINFLLLIVMFVKSKNLKENKTNKFINAIIWIFVVLFALNTLGNLFAKTIIEQILGTFLTFLSSILCWLIVKEKRRN